ncbi:MAG: hypothetical protein J6Q22_03195 [Prevotella sp.]|nr:hypothetical protein [Prevotella sp.]
MSTSILLSVLFASLLFGIAMFVVMLFNKKDDSRFNKISAIATFVTAISSIIVGIATVNALSFQERSDKLQNQPLYMVRFYYQYSQDNKIAFNEEFEIENVGKKTKSQTTVDVFSFLVIEYSSQRKQDPTRVRHCKVDDYFGFRSTSGSYDGEILHSLRSGDNNKKFNELYWAAHEYQQKHPGVFVAVSMEHFFRMNYTDIYGDIHTVVKKDNVEVDEKQLIDVLGDTPDVSYSILNLDLDNILKDCFPEDF